MHMHTHKELQVYIYVRMESDFITSAFCVGIIYMIMLRKYFANILMSKVKEMTLNSFLIFKNTRDAAFINRLSANAWENK